MSTLQYSSQNSTDSIRFNSTDNVLCGVFIAPGTFTIEKIVIRCWRDNDFDGDVTLNLRAVDGSHKPTGAVLATSTVPASSIPDYTATGGSVQDVDFELETPYEVTNLTEYSITLLAPEATGPGDSPSWGVNNSSGYYRGVSVDSGSSWTMYSSRDMGFDVYELDASLPENPTPSDMGTGISRFTSTLTWDYTLGEGETLDVYFREFGDGYSKIAEAIEVNSASVLVEFPKLNWGTTYLWRVDVNRADETVDAGTEWQFTTESFTYYPQVNAGAEDADTDPTKRNMMASIRRLVVASDNGIWIGE